MNGNEDSSFYEARHNNIINYAKFIWNSGGRKEDGGNESIINIADQWWVISGNSINIYLW
jgi:hypothetical protein